jgi:hypothetical protein
MHLKHQDAQLNIAGSAAIGFVLSNNYNPLLAPEVRDSKAC